jgi:hypothetical protein
MGFNPVYKETAEALGSLIAQKGFELVYGGSNIGTMRVLADACMRAGGRVTGVMPHLLAGKEILHTGISEIITCDTMSERKEIMGRLSDAFIALPGGLGTLDELFEVLSWLQLNISDKPVGILNTIGYYNFLLSFLDLTVKEGFMRSEHRSNIVVAETPAGMIDRLIAYKPVEVSGKWVDELIQDTNRKHI